jgi:hypothetical protein
MRSSKTENRETALARLHVLAAILLAFQPLFGLLCAFLCFSTKHISANTSKKPPNYQKKTTQRSIEIWLILPVVICLFQGLSHACLRITAFAGICAWLITSDVICRKVVAVSARLDTLAKRQANT